MAKGTKLSEFEKGEITALKRVRKYQKNFKGLHHHHIALVARISLILSHPSSLSFIAQGRSSGQYPVSSHSC